MTDAGDATPTPLARRGAVSAKHMKRRPFMASIHPPYLRGSSGSGGADGAGGGSATSSTTGGVTTPALELQYAATDTTVEPQHLSFMVQVKNTDDASIALSDLTIRFWFTADVAKVDLKSECDFSSILGGCANATRTFGEASGTQADHYLELGLLAAAGRIAPNVTSGDVQIRIHNGDNYDRMTQTDDYSFGANTTFMPFERVTVYHDGVLTWGTEP
ncbi:cellulose binding domain-containing protein [Sorangium sp. So ce145]|uniref:cellulose binding domain-containing protein n=1 Tax=Sorangium sp. So ce145 TaxID=3133285 RepID=UPI003F60519E